MRWLVVALLLVSRIGYVARAPDITQQRIELRDAKAFIDIVGEGTFELSQSAEHRALPDSDAKLRDPSGTLPWEINFRTSTRVNVVVSRNRVEGWLADVTTSSPHDASPRWRFASPAYDAGSPPPGWAKLDAKLQAMPKLEVAIGGGAARVDRVEWQGKWMIVVAFGPLVDATTPSAPAKSGGCST